MRKAIIIISILILTVSFGIFELVSVKKTLTTLEDLIMDLDREYNNNKNDISVFYTDVGDIKEYWENQEEWLCFLFNHRDLSIITDSMNRLSAYTKNNDFDNAICELSLLKEYSTKSYHILGFNIHNIL